jgi:hypothetical protein
LIKFDLKEDYKPLPKEWVGEVIPKEDAPKYLLYAMVIEVWDNLPADCEIRSYDSGYSQGIVLVKDGQAIAEMHLMHYSRMRHNEPEFL